MKPILPFILLACLSACSHGNGQPDAGDPDADAADGGDPSDVDTRPDYDPAQSFLLTVPDDTSLCFGFCEGRTWRQELDMIGRIDLIPGHYVLPRQEGFYRSELVDGVIFGPGQNQLQPVQSPMECQAEYQNWGDGQWHYTCRKSYAFSGESYNLEVFILIRPKTGNWPEEVTIDVTDPSLVIHAKLYIGAGVDFRTEIQTFGPCELPGLGVYTATTASGHRVNLDMRGGVGCRMVGETACLFLTSARVQLSNFDEQAIHDRFRLVYVGSHHNWDDEYLIFLNPPAGNTHVVLVDAPSYMGSTGYVIQMDANFNEVSRDEITDWQYD
jgi:hypothetical protein